MPRKIHHQQGLVDYLALGPDRSLTKLHRHYVADESVTAPSISSIRNWSRKHEWVALAQRHDTEVRAGIGKKIRTTQVDREFDLTRELLGTVNAALREVNEALVSGAVEVRTCADVKALIDGSVAAMRVMQDLSAQDNGRNPHHDGQHAISSTEADELSQFLDRWRQGQTPSKKDSEIH